MLERFATEARDAVTAAHDAAQRHGAAAVTSAHLLGAAVSDQRSVAARAVLVAGTEPAALADAALRADDGIDAEALAAIGVDLDAVRAQVEDEFGAGALDHPHVRGARRLPFAPDARKTLELALREAIASHDKRIDSGHLLLGAARLERRAPAARVLASLGVDTTALPASVARCRHEQPAA